MPTFTNQIVFTTGTASAIGFSTALYPGRTGNGGTRGPRPVPRSNIKMIQLIDGASLVAHEPKLAERGINLSLHWMAESNWSDRRGII